MMIVSWRRATPANNIPDRQQAAAPRRFEALAQPDRDPPRPWLHLLDDATVRFNLASGRSRHCPHHRSGKSLPQPRWRPDGDRARSGPRRGPVGDMRRLPAPRAGIRAQRRRVRRRPARGVRPLRLHAVHHPALLLPRGPNHDGARQGGHSGGECLSEVDGDGALLLQLRSEPGVPRHDRAGRAHRKRH